MASRAPPTQLALAVAMLAAATAGCLGGEEATGPQAVEAASYEEAASMEGWELEPVEGTTALVVELLAPASPEVASPGTQPVVVLVHDAQAGEPVEDAELALEARMPAMGHGTGPETDPTHVGAGVYEGQTTWSMEGEWVLELTLTLADGTQVAYAPTLAVGSFEQDPDRQPIEPYASFGEVMAAPGTVYEGEPTSQPVEERGFSDDVGDPTYERSEELAFEGHHLEQVRLEATMNATTPVAQLNVTLTGPSGSSATIQLAGDADEDQAVIEGPQTGTWELAVTGRGLAASYEILIEAAHEPQHVDLKLLDPSDPTNTPADDRRILVAVFEAFGPEPMTDASVRLTASPPPGGTAIEETLTDQGHGQYRTTTGIDAEGDWQVTVDVQLPNREAHRYETTLEATA